MKTRTKTICTTVALAALFLVAWLFWPTWMGPTTDEADEARWTVLEAPATAKRYRPGVTRGSSTELIDPVLLTPGLVLHPHESISSPGPVRLTGPDGSLIILESVPGWSISLRWHPATPLERLTYLCRAIAAPFAVMAEAVPFWRGVVAPEPVIFGVLVASGLAFLRLRPRWVGRSLGSRQVLATVLVLWTLGVFLLAGLGQVMLGLSIYSGAVGPFDRVPRDHWAALQVVLGPLESIVFMLGLFSLSVITLSFVRGGKAQLHALGWGWWLAGAAMSLLILLGLGAPLLPFVDVDSNTEAWLQQFERFATNGAGPLIWPWLLLLVERAIPLTHAAEAESPAIRFARAPLATACVLGVGLMLAQGLRDGELQEHLTRSTDGQLAASEARERANTQRLACGATHVVHGTARNFRVVPETRCLAHGDGLQQPDPGVLKHCEALEFQVAVAAQIWPLPPTGTTAEPFRTLRLSGVAKPVEALKQALAEGPRTYYAQMGGDGILRNTRRGMLVTEGTPAVSSRGNGGMRAYCGRQARLAEAMRTTCGWDVAFVGSLTEARVVGGMSEPRQWETTVTVDRVLDGVLLPGGSWRVRADAGTTHEGDPRETALAADVAEKRTIVVMGRRDLMDAGLLHVVSNHGVSGDVAWFPEGSLSAQTNNTQIALRNCKEARQAFQSVD